MTVTNGFKNTSPHSCALVGYPGGDLVTPAGGVLINVLRRPANAAHRLTFNWGNLVVTPPNGFVSHPMPVDMPICNASISTVD